MRVDEYIEHDATSLAELVRKGEVTPGELLERAIAVVEALNPRVNAIVRRMFGPAHAAVDAGLPDGPFRGVPFLIKDLSLLVAGEPMRCGSRFLEGWVPDHDSELITRFRNSGLVALGKTSTPELGLTPYTEPELFGPTRNPWNPERISGGSSGGSAAAVASRMVPIAGGGDGGGSIRIPAACCGLFGLKPTRGRTPTGPDRGELWQGCVVDHVLTRSVRDSAAALDAIAGPDVGAPYYMPAPERPYLAEVGASPAKLRIAFTTRPMLGRAVHPDCVAAVEKTVRLLRSLGHTVEEAAPAFDGRAFARNFMLMVAGECRGDIEEAARLSGRTASAAGFEPPTWALGLLGRSISAADFVTATRALQMDARRIGQFFTGWDVLLTPTVSTPPPPVGSLQPSARDRTALSLLGRMNAGKLLDMMGMLDQAAAEAFEFTPWTPVFNVTGQPAMSVPLEWNSEGLPIGLHLVGRFGDEATLFRLAAQLEQAQPWAERRPAVS